MKKHLHLIFTFTVLGISHIVYAQPVASICAVTVDELAGAHEYPVVIWDRLAQISVDDIDSILVYRDDAAGQDSLIARLDYDDLSEYHDINSNAGIRSYRYKIQAKDVNGVLGPLSLPFETMHFSLFEDVQNLLKLQWTTYVGSTFNLYNCWDMEDLVTPVFQQANTGNGWTFSAAQPGMTYTMKVDLEGMLPCVSSRANHNTARSNKSTIAYDGGTGLGWSENGIREVSIYPNPVNTSFTLTFSSLNWEETSIVLMDISGRKVLDIAQGKFLGQHKIEIPAEQLAPGYYQVVIMNGTKYSFGVIKN
jgi:hypothetical protein